jgi:hypothetical protein
MSIRERLRDERGMAIVTAMLLSMVVVTLGATSVTLAVHNSEQSARDRRRVQGVAAAEAGINWYYSHLQSGTASSFQCTRTDTLPGTPTTTFTATLLDPVTRTPLICPLSDATLPTTGTPPLPTVLIRSVGTTTNNPVPTRTLESQVRLTPTSGTPFGDTAIYSNSSVSWPANVKILGNEASNTDVYVNGDAAISSASVVYGSLYATGSISMRGNAQVRRDAWATTALSLSQSARVLGNGISSTSSISVKNKANIGMDATYCTSIQAGGSAVGGLKLKKCPPDQVLPPISAFPPFAFDQAAWELDGYQVETFTGVSACTTAQNFVKNLSNVSGPYSYVVRITEDCTLSFNKDAPYLTGNLAIISDGGFTAANNTKFSGTGGVNLHLMFGVDDALAPCDVTWGNSGGVSGDVNTLIYTPCTISFGSNGTITRGQLFGGNVLLKPSFSMNAFPVPVPGFGAGGYEEDVLYLREVVTGT